MPNAAGMILPGMKPVLELLKNNPRRIAKIYYKNNLAGKNAQSLQELAHKHGIHREPVNAEKLNAICSISKNSVISHQGVIAILRETAQCTLDQILARANDCPLPLILALDRIQDPGNIGSLCRTAWALGCAGLILPKHNSAPLSPAAARSSAGTLALMPFCIVANLARALDEAEENGFAIYGAGCTQTGSENAFEHVWHLPAVLTLGGEQNGLRPGVTKRCQNMLHIPLLRQFDSLNVAQAGGILISLCAAWQLKQSAYRLKT